jgi:hypothetical protein
MADVVPEKQLKRQSYFPIWLTRTDGQNYDYESIVLRDIPGDLLLDEDDLDRTSREKWEIILGMFLKDQLADNDDSE